MNNESMVSVVGTIQNISRFDCCSQMVSVLTDNNEIINFIVSPNTLIIDSTMLRPRMRIAAFYDSSRPAILIFPPQYPAEIISVLSSSQNVIFSYFDNRLTAQNNALRLNISARTRISTINGQPFECNLANNLLLVYYTVTTRSIPPQTTPERIIVFC